MLITIQQTSKREAYNKQSSQCELWKYSEKIQPSPYKMHENTDTKTSNTLFSSMLNN